MQVSLMGRELVKKFEGLHTVMKDGRVRSYRCPAGKWTIGYGHTKGVRSGQHITREQAEEFLTADLADCEAVIRKYVKVELTQNQFDAIASFIFNLGEGNFASSTLLKRLNANLFGEVPQQLARWNKGTVKGKKVVMAGLTRRRAAEAALFTMDVPLASEPDARPMPQKVSLATPKPLLQSRTLAGAGIATLGVTLATLAEQLQPLIGISEHIETLFMLVTLAGIFLSAYARWDDARNGDA